MLETERLILRPPRPEDAPAIAAGIGDWEVAKNLATAPHPYSLADAQQFIAGLAPRQGGGDVVLGITLKAGGAYIGGCGLHLRGPGIYEIGYWLTRDYWGQGYASEAAAAVLAYAFGPLQARRVVADWFTDNPASGHVLEKLGFVPAGTSLRDCAARNARVFCHDMLLENARADALPLKEAV